MNRRGSQERITRLAKGQPCTIRLAGRCNFNPETTVPCHFRMMDFSGMGFLSPAFLIAFGCSNCHEYVDTHKDAETQLDFAKGVFRTLAALHRLGAIQL